MDTASLYAIFPVREKDALRIKKGMPASVLTDGTGEKSAGVVDLVYPQADSQSLSFLVRVLLPDTLFNDVRLKPGMFARITVTLGEPRKAVFISESAIFNRAVNGANEEGSVFAVNGSTLTERKVLLGAANSSIRGSGDDREIVSGIAAGELVVSRPDTDLKEGMNVTIMD
jgi:multidrug efflux pump subunit AcrA (membrane-fusion protein)